MGYRAIARLKFEDGYIERGEKVTASDVEGKDNLKRLAESGSIATDSDFTSLFPNFDADTDQPEPEPVEPDPVEPKPDSNKPSGAVATEPDKASPDKEEKKK